MRTWRPPTSSRWEREEKLGPLAGLGFDPDPPVVSLDNAPANSQSDASAGVFIVRMQALEEAKNGFTIFTRYTDTIVFNAEEPKITFSSGVQTNPQGPVVAVLYGVTNQILKHLRQVTFPN